MLSRMTLSPLKFLTHRLADQFLLTMPWSDLRKHLCHAENFRTIVRSRLEGFRHRAQARHPRNVEPAPPVAPKLKSDQRSRPVSIAPITVRLHRPELVVVPEAYSAPVADSGQDYLVHAAPAHQRLGHIIAPREPDWQRPATSHGGSFLLRSRLSAGHSPSPPSFAAALPVSFRPATADRRRYWERSGIDQFVPCFRRSAEKKRVPWRGDSPWHTKGLREILSLGPATCRVYDR